jgi:sugar lactone lactonase YvrE
VPKIEVLADYVDLCGESPIWDAVGQNLYWTDITGRRFFKWSLSRRATEVVAEGFEIAGFALRKQGGFVVTNSTGFWLWDRTGAPQLIAEAADGQICALNDCTTDPEGRLFAGSCFYDPSREDYPSGYLFRADLDGSVHVVCEGLRLSNGLGFSPDETTLYLTDSAVRTIYAFDYCRKDGRVRNKRVFVKVPSDEGIPDGLTVDSAGFVWSVQWFGGCLVRYDPDGAVERRIAIPASQTTSMAFGGPALTDIFVTSASTPDALPLAPPGYRADQVYNGGKLFHVNVDIQGKEEYHARIGT